MLLNILPIFANGGLMPVTAENLAKIGETDRIEGRQEGDAIPHTKNVLKSKDNTHFYELSDRIVWDNPFFFRVFSAGDVVIAGGLIVTLGDLFLPRVRRETRPSRELFARKPVIQRPDVYLCRRWSVYMAGNVRAIAASNT